MSNRPATLPWAFALVCLLASTLFSQTYPNRLDCWVPTREEHFAGTGLTIKSPQVAPMRQALLAAEDVVRGNPHFRAMPRAIRIRSTIAVGEGTPRYGQLNTNAYRPDVWATGKCDVVPGADRCCRDGMITMTFNDPRPFVRGAMKDDVIEMFEEPTLTGRVGGFPEYNGIDVLISVGGAVPWTPVTVAEYLEFHERRLQKSRAEATKNLSQPGIDPAKVQTAYENMKKIDPKAAEEFLANMRKLMAEAPARMEKTRASTDALYDRDFAALAALRASLSSSDLQRQAAVGEGPMQLAKAGDPRARSLVKMDPTFFDTTSANRIQLIRVNVGVHDDDPVSERRETMKATKQTLDYAALATLLR